MEPRNAKEIEVIKQELAGYFEDLSMRLITSISDKDIERLNGYQRIISAGICVDKLRLLRNESTSNISMEMIHANMEEREERRIELKKRLYELTGEDYETRRKKLREKVLRRLGKLVEGNPESDQTHALEEESSKEQ